MGGESSSTQQTSQTTTNKPYWQAQKPMDTLLGNLSSLPTPGPNANQTNAFDNLVALGQQGNPFAGAIENATGQMLTGGPDRTGIAGDAYAQFQQRNAPTANGAMLDPNQNPWFGATTASITDKAFGRLNDAYAAAGVSPTGYGSYGSKASEAITEALAPVYSDQYNRERGLQMNAINAGLAGGQSTANLMTDMDRTRFGNQVAGAGMADAAQAAKSSGYEQIIMAEAQRTGMAPEQIAQRMGIILPVADTFGTKNMTGTQTGTQKMSGADQFYKIASGVSGFFKPKAPISFG